MKEAKGRMGHLKTSPHLFPAGSTHRIFAIARHLSACEREPGAGQILAEGVE